MSIVITGASGGLGEAVVRAFLETGERVYGVARSWKANPHAASLAFHPVEADVTTAAGCSSAVDAAAPIDTLVHLVGGFAGGNALAQADENTWDQMMNVNLRSAFLMMRAALPKMLERRQGRILAVGSRAAVEPMAGFAAYSVSKAGLVALVRTVALEVKDSGITANVVLPSIIDTPANRAAMPKANFSKWVQPEAIARLLVWLASEAAGDISGAAIPIYGKV